MALALRAILILRAAFARAPSLWIAPMRMRSRVSLTCLNFADERDLARQNTDSNRGEFKFKSEKIS